MLALILSMIFLIYVVFNFILAINVYRKCKKFYSSEKHTPQNSSENDIIIDKDIHQKYPEWKRLDKLSFSRIFLGLIFLYWIRLFSFFFLLLVDYICLKLVGTAYNEKLVSPSKRNLITKINYFFFGSILFFFGMRTTKIQIRYDDIYKKYLGPDYSPSFNDNYSIIISNHLSWVEILYYIKIFSPGFIAKESVKNLPLIGRVAIAIESLFLDRTKSDDRANVVKYFLLIT